MNQLIQSKNFRTFIVLAAALVGFAFLPLAQAVGPDTEGAIAGGNNGEGIGVLGSRTTGVWNSGTGFEALNSLTAGNQNTAAGLRALFSDISGGYNTATGVFSLFSNTIGFFNTASGAYSLAHNTDGGNNTANGYSALYFNTEGEQNTATGFAALYKNSTGTFNTANGCNALLVLRPSQPSICLAERNGTLDIFRSNPKREFVLREHRLDARRFKNFPTPEFFRC
jgi:hypothetical protein